MMRSPNSAIRSSALVVVGATFLALAGGSAALAGDLSTLYRFTNGADGGSPFAGPTLTKTGVLIGTASSQALRCQNGDAGSCGVVWRISPGGAEETLFDFRPTFTGYQPFASLVLHDRRLYGTTENGGINGKSSQGFGTIFSIGRDGRDFELLHRFNGPDGALPGRSKLLFDAAGSIYGVTFGGGAPENGGGGVLFKLTSDGTYTVLHRFGTAADPSAGPTEIVMDKAGVIYGAAQGNAQDETYGGSIYSYDTVSNTVSILHKIIGKKQGGAFSIGGLNERGDLFGTAAIGGHNGQGVLFALRKTAGGYVYRVLHDFTGKQDGGDPAVPFVTVHGGITGTTITGGMAGAATGKGTIYSYEGGVFTTLYTFTGGMDGGGPVGTPIVVNDVIYGTTATGGAACMQSPYCGTIWMYTP